MVLEPKCDACGVADHRTLKALLRNGQMNYGQQPDVRAMILCEECRTAQAALIQAMRAQDAAETAPEAIGTPRAPILS